MQRKKVIWMAVIIVFSAAAAFALLKWQRASYAGADGYSNQLPTLTTAVIADPLVKPEQAGPKKPVEANGEKLPELTPVDEAKTPPTPRHPAAGIHEIVGLRSSLDISDAKVLKEQMADIWGNFYRREDIQNAVNWQKPVTLFAIYEGLDEPRARVTVGYPSALLDSVPKDAVRQKVLTDASELHAVEGTKLADVIKAWEKVRWEPSPRSVTEIYQLNTEGDVQKVHLEVRY